MNKIHTHHILNIRVPLADHLIFFPFAVRHSNKTIPRPDTLFSLIRWAVVVFLYLLLISLYFARSRFHNTANPFGN